MHKSSRDAHITQIRLFNNLLVMMGHMVQDWINLLIPGRIYASGHCNLDDVKYYGPFSNIGLGVAMWIAAIMNCILDCK